MNILKIKNFKCFSDQEINLNKITVLTGSNGSGKSSIIQAVLLLRESASNRSRSTSTVNLNRDPRLRLGDFEEIINDENKLIKLSLDGYDIELNFLPNLDGKECASVIHSEGAFPEWLSQDAFYYLNAERIGPRLEERIHLQENCGDCGEATGSVLLNAQVAGEKVQGDRSFDKGGKTLQIEVDNWMSHICGDASFKPERLSDAIYRLKIKKQTQRPRLATNTGFGYTYALPIVVTGLIAKKGGIFIVENPEAHLHPKAQSNMGFFLGKIASAGVQVLIETHSEHIVNGLRRASLSRFEGLSYNDLSIYFVSGQNETQCTEIRMDAEGNLSDFPLDFFDQVRQDMLEIIRLSTIDNE